MGTQNLNRDIARGRKYALWSMARYTLVGICALAAVAALVFAILGVANIFFDLGLSSEASIMVGTATTPLAFFSALLYPRAKKQMEKYPDPLFNPPGYSLALKGLRRSGVKRPIRFLYENREYAIAYQSVHKAANTNIDGEYEKPTIISEIASVLNGRFSADYLDEHKVASLVFPGSKELSRQTRIEHLIKDRGISTYTDIKEMLDQNTDVPLALDEGAL